MTGNDKLKVIVNNTNTNTLTNSNIQNAAITLSIINALTGSAKLAIEEIKNLYQNAKNFLINNKTYILPTCLVTIYSSIVIICRNGRNYIQNKNLWFNWKKETTLENLEKIDEKELGRVLLLDIQKTYINYENPLEFNIPITKFMKELDKERKLLNFYFSLYKFLKNTKLIFAVPVDLEILSIIPKKINRINFLQNIFVSWLFSSQKFNFSKL